MVPQIVPLLRCLWMVLGLAMALPAWAGSPAGGAFRFGLIGDQQYDAAGEAAFPSLMAGLDQADLAFVIHDGDFKPGSAPCTDLLFKKRLAEFNKSAHPFIYTPGDNEWTDCAKSGFDPAERLEALRRLFFAKPESLGRQRLPLASQGESKDPRFSPFKENLWWVRGPALFATLHVTGSHNHRGRTPADRVEYKARNRANLAWIAGAFARARQGGQRGVLIAMQADPAFEAPAGSAARFGFEDILASLEKETRAFKGSVVLVHGDSHFYRQDHPAFEPGSPPAPNFTRVETFGPGDPRHWVQGIVDPADPALFRFEVMEINPN